PRLGLAKWQTRRARCAHRPHRRTQYRSAFRPDQARRSGDYRHRRKSLTQMPADLIRFENVTKIYGQGDAAVVALDRINLRIESGEFLAILCPSGFRKLMALN